MHASTVLRRVLSCVGTARIAALARSPASVVFTSSDAEQWRRGLSGEALLP